MVNRLMFHATQCRGAARFSAVCFLATLMLTVAVPLVSAQTNGCGSDNGGITLPSGFCATIFADNLGHARQMAFSTLGAAAIIRMTSRQMAASLWHSKIPRAMAAPT